MKRPPSYWFLVFFAVWAASSIWDLGLLATIGLVAVFVVVFGIVDGFARFVWEGIKRGWEAGQNEEAEE